jgi:hypothetical protein
MITRGAAEPMLTGKHVYRVHWVLGTDRLRGVCHCAAAREFDDPVELWAWLLAHPEGPPAHQPTNGNGSTP